MLMLVFHFVWIQLLVLFAGGLVLLHFSAKHRSAPLKAGGIVLVAGAVLSAVCVLYYAARYMGQGAFETPHPMMMHRMGGMMGPGMMMRHGPGPSDADQKDEHGR